MNNMALNHHTTLFLAVLLTSTLLVSTTGEMWWPWQPASVHISNNLEGHGNLQVHCKDKSHDVGAHQIPYGQTYLLKVYRPWLQSTDYYCGFLFDNVLHWFDIYVEPRDWYGCGTSCRWSILEAGPCLADPYACYPWKP